ncbi:glycerol-3-phosphate dehydrogenase [Ketobacter alkanivorans]|uniref:Glycerol-3-phosphate dehydrogenase n=1 Tax=Ketobacter alkanivorans TaxID=1917421 RepID=A0A2K9LQ15_9GAMM|nr:glycerol-3-phosphate dehydrogenase [Ketobacter alkanivorans]AUM14449.1 glycerol-3-phosphate dehydrogenase [Ketobacter alkanivorans]
MQSADIHQGNSADSGCYDLFIVGGGINGTGIADAASTRGLKVALCEQNDLASATSSASSKLIHGGLRYLEHYEFRLVREALAEREILLHKAPHLIKPLRFVLPHRPHLRPAWMIRIGLFMYDHLTRRNKIPGSTGLTFANEDTNNPLLNSINKGFQYYDCRVDDARLVITNAIAARDKGAHIQVHTRCVGAKRVDGLWHIRLEDKRSGKQSTCTAKALVNASGPWAQRFIEQSLHTRSPRKVNLIKGSHFVTRKLYEGDQAYILQNEDQRIVFVIPYQDDFTLIGTTDKVYSGDPSNVEMDADEERYLLDIVNAHFKQPLTGNDILWKYSGVRPLCDDESDSPSAMTRDYTLDIEADENKQAPLLSIFGGKITTYRRLSLAAMKSLKAYLPEINNVEDENTTLPGGDIGETDYDVWVALVQQQYEWLDGQCCKRLCDTYGTRMHSLLSGCRHIDDLGHHFGAGLFQQEVDYLMQQEWANTAEDIIWRRSKLGLRLDPQQIAALSAYVAEGSIAPANTPEAKSAPHEKLKHAV